MTITISVKLKALGYTIKKFRSQYEDHKITISNHIIYLAKTKHIDKMILPILNLWKNETQIGWIEYPEKMSDEQVIKIITRSLYVCLNNININLDSIDLWLMLQTPIATEYNLKRLITDPEALKT